MTIRLLILSFILTGLMILQAGAQEEAKADPKPKPAVKRIGESRFRLGEIEFDSKSKEMFVPVVVNMREGGPIEYVLVHENGKVHESIFTTKASPLDLQIVMNLLSYKAGAGDIFDSFLAEELREKEAGKKEDRGDPVTVLFRWKAGEEEKETPAASLVIDGEKAEPMSQEPWVFTGSKTEGGNFMAEAEGSIIAVYLDHLSIFNMTREGAEIDERWGANGDLIPETGTKGTLVLKKAD